MNAALSIDGTTVDTFVSSMSNTRTVATADTTGFGVTDQTLIAGLESSGLTCSGPWDDATIDAMLDGALDGAEVAVLFGPEGRTTGDVQYSYNAIVTNETVTVSNTQAAQWSLSAARSGATTVGTF